MAGVGMQNPDFAKSWNDYLSQVRKIARSIYKRLPRHIDPNDLIQVGALGLLNALHRFDPSKKVSFEIYAGIRIRGAILDELRRLDYCPRWLRQAAKEIEHQQEIVRNRGLRECVDSYVAESMSMPIEEYHRLRANIDGLRMASGSHNAEGRSEETTLIDLVAAPVNQNPFEQYHRSQVVELLGEALKKLSAKHKQVLQLYYFQGFTQGQIGSMLGITESRVCQLHREAVDQLREALRQQGVNSLTELSETNSRPYVVQ